MAQGPTSDHELIQFKRLSVRNPPLGLVAMNEQRK